MKPLNSWKKKRYYESIQGEIDPIFECEVWRKYNPEYVETSICEAEKKSS